VKTKGKFLLLSIAEFDSWLASASISRAVSLVQNHHSFLPGYEQFDGGNHFDLLSGMEHYHMVERGFDMIAQNLTTFPDGTVAVCRPLDRIPAGIKGGNKSGICIEHLGNFDAGCDVMTEEHRDCIVRLNASLCQRFGLAPSTGSIVYHHWYDLESGHRTNGAGVTKSCPGSAFFGGNSVAAAQANLIPFVIGAVTQDTHVVTPLRSGEVGVELLNVRGGAGMQYPILKRLSRGVILKMYEEFAGWYRISPQGDEWVYGQYVQVR